MNHLLVDPSLAIEDASYVVHFKTAAGGFAPILGGVVAIAAGPRVTMTAGAAVLVMGYAALAASPTGGVPYIPITVTAIGGGLFAPAALIALAHELGYPRENGRVAAFAATFLFLNVASFVGTLVAPALSDGGDATAAFVLASLTMLLAASMGGVVIYIHRRVGEAPRRAVFPRPVAVGVVILLLLYLPFLAGANLFAELQFDVLTAGRPSMSAATESGASLGGAVLLTLGATVVAFVKAPPMTLRVAGAAMIVCALGLGLGAAAEPTSAEALMPSSIMLAFGEMLLTILLASRVTADTSPRFATLVYAGWTSAAGAAGFVTHLPIGRDGLQASIGILAALTLVCGGLLGVLAPRIRARWFTPAA